MALQVLNILRKTGCRSTKFSPFSLNINHYLSTDIDILAANKEDAILLNIKQANNTGKLFNFVSINIHKFNGEHAVQALRAVYDLIRNEDMEFDPQALRKSAAFDQICKSVKKHSRGLDLNDIIESLKIINFLQVPSDSLITQTLLQLIKEEINDLNLKQIVFMDYLLSRLGKSHLIDALKIALPLVFQIRLGYEMDHNDVNQLTSLLLFASRNKLHTRSVNNIVTGLSLIVDDINTQNAKSIVWSLCDLDLHDSELYAKSINLLNHCMDNLVKNIDSIKHSDIFTTIEKLKMKILDQHMEFYHEDFINASAAYAERHNMDLPMSLIIADHLTRIGAPNIQLLLYISKLCAESPDFISSLKPRSFITLLRSFSNANFKPPEWDLYKENILNHPILESNDIKYPWTVIIQSLAVLNCFSHSLNKKLFDSPFLKRFLDKQNNVLDNFQLLISVAAVREFDVNYVGPFPTSDIMRNAKYIHSKQPMDNTIEPVLDKIINRSDNYIKGVQTEDGFMIDFAFAMGENGTIFQLNTKNNYTSEITNYSDIIFPQNSEIVLIMVFHRGCYSMNTNRLRGHFELQLKVLRNKGHRVVPVSRVVWKNLRSSERADYLIREINLTLPDTHKLLHMSRFK